MGLPEVSEVNLEPGMRVVVRDIGPWPYPQGAPRRFPGHYGKVAEIGHPICDAYIRVDLTGHIDGGPVDPDVVHGTNGGWFYDSELEVVD
jgi:hypothetical protein